MESKLHWVLDVCFGEGQSRAWEGYAAENWAAQHRMVLNLLKQEKTSHRGIKGKRLLAGWKEDYLLKVLSGLGEIV